jgi:hypothetical protein
MTLELAHIFPVMASGRQLTHAWTTYESQLPPEFAHVYQEALADKPLGVHKVSSKTKHALVTPPPPASPSQSLPTVAWEALYPTGSVNPSAPIPGGFGFYLCGPEAFAKALPDATEVIMSYSCMFEREWEWVKGGKLPGICEPRIVPIVCIALSLRQMAELDHQRTVAPVDAARTGAAASTSA